MTTKFTTLRVYLNNLNRQVHPFSCPHCQVSIYPKDFENHCSTLHGINSRYSCVWCLGSKTWGKGKKNENALHLHHCFKKFRFRIAADVSRQNLVSPSYDNVKNSRMLNMTPMCASLSFFDHQDLSHDLPPRAFEEFNVSIKESVTYFRDPNLNCAASYVRKYLETRDETDWHHVMIKAISFESFLNAVDEEGSKKILILPFSCWCDGGTHIESWFRQHRHMIVVSAKNHFSENVWPKIKPKRKIYRTTTIISDAFSMTRTTTVPKNFVSKRMKKIDSPMHLVNTLGYLSKRESNCGFTIDSKKSSSKDLQKKHFYIFKTLPVDFRLPLAVQWEDGLMKQMYLELFQNVSTFELANSALIFQDGKYNQKIKDFYKFRGGLVLPISKQFIPTEEETPHFVHLLGGRKLYFKDTSSSSGDDDDDDWLRKQVSGGNCFYENVGEEMWKPRPKDQSILLNTRPIVEENRILQSENRDLKEENRNLKEEITNLKSKYEYEIGCLKSKYEDEIRCLKSKYEEEIRCLKSKYEEEIRCLKSKYEEEITNLKRKYEDEIGCLKTEIVNLKINYLRIVEENNVLLKEKIQRQQQEIEELKNDNQRLKGKVENQQQEIEELKNDNQRLKENVESQQQEIEELKNDNQRLKENVENQQQEIEELKNGNQRLVEKKRKIHTKP